MKRVFSLLLIVALCVVVCASCDANNDPDEVYVPLSPVATYESPIVTFDPVTGLLPFNVVGDTIQAAGGVYIPIPNGFIQDPDDPSSFFSTRVGDVSMFFIEIGESDAINAALMANDSTEELLTDFMQTEGQAMIEEMTAGYPGMAAEIVTSEIRSFGDNKGVHLIVEMSYMGYSVRGIITVFYEKYSYTIMLLEMLDGYDYWDDAFYSCLAQANIV